MAIKDDVKADSSRLADKAGDAAHDLADAARKTAHDASDALTEEARRRGESAKSAAAAEISTVSDALRKAANDLQAGSPQERTFGYLANNLADMSDTVRDKDMGELVDDISYYARNNPLLFLGGAALLGFAVTRFSKASARPSAYDPDTAFNDGRTFASASPAGSPAASVSPSAPHVQTGKGQGDFNRGS